MKSSLHQDIYQEYSHIRDRQAIELKKRTESVYNKIPRISEIDRQMGQMGMDIVRWVLRNPKDQDKALNEIRATLESLQRERVRLLTENGLDPAYLEMQYQCSSCKDTGTTKEGHMCRCFRQRLINRAYAASNLGHFLRQQHFGVFNLELFSDAPFPGKELSPKKNMSNIRSVALRFIEQFESISTPNLIFYGETGLGKTFLCSCLAKSLLDKGYSVLYLTAFKIAEAMERYKFGDKENPNIREAYQMIYDCDLLIVDDWGTELNNAFTNVEFFNILNTRLMSQKKMIFSTNLATPDLLRTYGDRVFSRISSHFDLLEFYGNDLRYK